MSHDYLWKIRCPESGYLVGECGCLYCFDEFEMDTGEFDYLEEDLDWSDDFGVDIDDYDIIFEEEEE